MNLYPADTIVAIATAVGRAGVGIVRISGTDAAIRSMAQALVVDPALMPRRADMHKFVDGDGGIIDSGLLIYFPAPHSFTGESVLELHGHGGRIVQQLLLQRACALGARLARPGEFSERAFLNDKIDLVQAEAIADLIDASTVTAARSAVRSLQGVFSTAVHQLVEALIELRMFVEACLDFPEEEIDFVPHLALAGKLGDLQLKLAEIFRSAQSGQRLQAGARLVLIGQPNVGKSTLMNCLADEDVAIVSDEAGTTRDTLFAQIELGGIPLSLIDTAGLRQTSITVEQMGIARTWKAIQQADLALLIVDSQYPLQQEDLAICRQLPPQLPLLVLANKADRSGKPCGFSPEVPAEISIAAATPEDHSATPACIGTITLSAKTGAGVDILKQTLFEHLGGQPAEDVFIARARHLDAIRSAQASLNEAAEILHSAAPPMELFAETLRLAQHALSSITGEFTSDDLLGAIFSRFCIGK